MPEIKFTESANERLGIYEDRVQQVSLRNITTLRGTKVQDIIDVTTQFTSDDFADAHLSPKIREMYSNLTSFYNRQQSFADSITHAHRPTAAYALERLADGISRPIGLVSFANYRDDLVAKFLHGRRRQFIGWFDRTRLPYGVDEDRFATTALAAGITVAGRAGLSKLQVLVDTEAATKDPRLVVVEHAADLKKLDFKEKGRDVFTIEGQDYEGVLWTRSV